MKTYLLIYYNPAEDMDLLWAEFGSANDALLEADRLENEGTYYENVRIYEASEVKRGTK